MTDYEAKRHLLRASCKNWMVCKSFASCLNFDTSDVSKKIICASKIINIPLFCLIVVLNNLRSAKHYSNPKIMQCVMTLNCGVGGKSMLFIKAYLITDLAAVVILLSCSRHANLVYNWSFWNYAFNCGKNFF